MTPELQHLTELLGPEKIARRVEELGRTITVDYLGRPIHLVVVLRGAFLFAADLIRHLPTDTTVDFIAISSYGGATRSSGVVRLEKDLHDDLSGRHVLLVEDILDTGLSLAYLHQLMRDRGPASLEVCVFLEKVKSSPSPQGARYVGFHIPDRFVVGYGLDFEQQWRGLAGVASLDPITNPTGDEK